MISKPYSEGNTSGNLIIDKTEYFKIFKNDDHQNLHIATHAIGDRALDIVLDTYALLKNRQGIEHASIIRTDQILKIKDVGATLLRNLIL